MQELREAMACRLALMAAIRRYDARIAQILEDVDTVREDTFVRCVANTHACVAKAHAAYFEAEAILNASLGAGVNGYHVEEAILDASPEVRIPQPVAEQVQGDPQPLHSGQQGETAAEFQASTNRAVQP